MNRFKASGLLLMALSLMACGKVEETPEVRTFGQKLTLEQDRVLGFEAPITDWSTNNGSARSLTSNASTGSGALAIVPNGYTELSSVQVDAPGSAATQATFDLRLPSVLSWGEARLIVKIPSQGQAWRDVGGIALAGRPAGVYQTLTFGLPSDLQAALNSSATDVSFMIVLNVAGGSGQYLVDNLKVTVDPGPPGPAPDPDLITIQLPAGQDIADRQVVAAGFLELRDAARVLDNDSATPAGSASDHVPLINLGTVSTHMSSGSKSGPLTSAASVWMGNNARVYGDLLTAGSLQMQAGASVSGTTTQNGTLPGVTTLSWQQPVLADPEGDEEILLVGQTRSLAPGSYNELVVYSGATLNLSSGNYAFSSMQLEPDATLNLNIDPAVGPVVLYVEDVLAWRSTTTPLDAEGLMLVYKGTQGIKFERSMGMALIAPHAKVTLATGGVPHFGSVYAQGISLDPQVVLTAVPFKYWDWIAVPPQPYVSCVYPSGAGHYMAAFGYKNERDVPVQIPAGVNNRFVPDSAKGIAVREGFAPGDHPESVWVDMPEDGVTWELLGQSATATREAPRCDFEHTRVEVPRRPHGVGPADPSGPPLLAPSKELIATRNALGAGAFFQRDGQGNYVDVHALLAGGGVPHPSWLPILGQPPILTQPGPIDGGVPYELEVTAKADAETGLEKAQIELAAEVGDSSYSRGLFAISNDGAVDVTKTYIGRIPVGGTGWARVDFWEEDKHSDPEYLFAELLIDDAAGTYTKVLRYPPFFEAVEEYTVPLGTYRDVKNTKQGKTNSLEWTVRKGPSSVDPDRKVKLCALWPTNYVDNGAETDPGYPLSSDGLRGYPASFAKYELKIVSAFEETHPPVDPEDSLYLDQDGCLREEDWLRASQLIYFDGKNAGGRGTGLELHMTLFGELKVPGTNGGSSKFFIYDYDEVELDLDDGNNPQWPPPVIQMELQETHFSEPGSALAPEWEVQNGYRVPPDQFTLTGDSYNEASNVVATVGRSLAWLRRDGTVLPSGDYPVEINSPGAGAPDYTAGATDFLCNIAGDSVAGGVAAYPISPIRNQDLKLGLRIGRGSFQVASPSEQNCDGGPQPIPMDGGVHGRRTCGATSPCPGGQICQSDVTKEFKVLRYNYSTDQTTVTPEERVIPDPDGCVDDGCYCALPAQGAWKFSTAHEFGHVVQDALMPGTLTGGYLFQCPNLSTGNPIPRDQCEALGSIVDYPGGVYYLADPPGTDPACGCGQVTSSNAQHCLQSIEITSTSQGEGFAQFAAALAYNSDVNAGCGFSYYKEVVGADCFAGTEPCTSTAVTLPPVQLDCSRNPAWRNVNSCGIDTIDGEGNPVTGTDMSTEVDWMTFMISLNDVINVGQIAEVYRRACHPENLPTNPACAAGEMISSGCFDVGLNCSELSGFSKPNPSNIDPLDIKGRELYWRDRPFSPPDPSAPGYDPQWGNAAPFDRGGFYDGAVRVFGEFSAQADDVALLGFEHAVDDNL